MKPNNSRVSKGRQGPLWEGSELYPLNCSGPDVAHEADDDDPGSVKEEEPANWTQGRLVDWRGRHTF